MRMTKASRASEVLGSMFQTNDYYGEMRESFQTEEFSRGQIIDAYEFLSGDDYNYPTGFQEILSESLHAIHYEGVSQELPEFYSSLDSETFEEVAKHFGKMSGWYESVLLEEGLISEGEQRTPSFLVLIALCIVYLASMMMMAIGYIEEDSFKIMTGLYSLGMGVLAFAAL